MSTSPLDAVEITCALRHLRVRRDALYSDMLLLEERERCGEDGSVRGALLVISSEIDILDGVIRHMWILQLEVMSQLTNHEGKSSAVPREPKP